MKNRVLLGGIAAVVALAVIAFAVAAMGDDDDSPQVETPALPTAPSGGGGAAAGSCPAADVPGISDEERERCFQADGGGTPVDEDEPVGDDETPVTSEPGATPSAPTPDEPLPAGRHAEPAPIDGLDIRVAESFPPQYFLYVQAGLPSGCAEQYKHEVSRDGDVITVTVLNSFPDGTPVCTMIYGIYELNIPLGSDFESGETYTVLVNDEETTFTAQ
jgi:hypothetical protein